MATKSRGEFFGELALIKEDVRTANVYAKGKKKFKKIPLVFQTITSNFFFGYQQDDQSLYTFNNSGLWKCKNNFEIQGNVTCYVLERRAFTRLIGNLTDAKEKTESSTELDKPRRVINPLVKKSKANSKF